MPYAKLIPFEEVVPAWPVDLFSEPPAGTLAIVGYEVVEQGTAITALLDIAVASDLTLSIAGLDEVELVLPGDPSSPLRVVVELAGPFEARLEGLVVRLRIQSDLLVPVAGTAPDWEPLLDGDGRPQPFEAAMNVGRIVIDEALQPRFELDGTVSLGAFMIGDTGVVVETTGVRPVLSANEPPPAGLAPGFRGVAIESAIVHLPDAFVLPGIRPDAILLSGLAIGHGGLSGSIGGAWTPAWIDGGPTGEGAGTFIGLPFGLRALGIAFAQNAIAGASLTGDLVIPFFDERIAVSVQVGVDGSYLLQAEAGAEQREGGLARLHKPGIGTLEVTGLGAVKDDAGEAILLSGRLTLEIAQPALQWPTIEVQDLRIARDGAIELPGGWIVLQEPIALDLFGFGMEITRIGFGNEDDGRRWIGLDGSVRLTDLLPAGASARGLRVLWDPKDPGAPPGIAFEGIGIAFGVSDAFGFEGAVSLTEDPLTGGRQFTGELGLGLAALDIGVDPGVTIGRAPAFAYLFVHLGIEVPIPIAATGAALYGLEGLFAMNMSPLVTTGPWPPDSESPAVRKGDWYGWYKQVPEAFQVTDPDKWSADQGAWAFGAGLSIGTLPDAGFTVNTKALLVVLLPGPVLLLEGKADLFKVPAALSSATQEGTLSLLAALDGRAGTLQLGIDAEWSLARVIEIAASTEAFFDFDHADRWHLWIGQDKPESARIRADYLSLFHADTWLMLSAKGVDTGLGVGWGDSWKFGVVRLTLEAWVAGRATLATRPAQLSGELSVGGEIALSAGPFGIGIAAEAGLGAESFSPYEVAGTLSVAVELPFPLKDLDVDIELKWTQPATPLVADPWSGALVEHERCTESWLPANGGSDATPPDDTAPVVPLDARVLLTFTQPMGDDTPAADNPPPLDPVTAIGAYQARYALGSVRLLRWRRSHPAVGWEDVSDTIVATWTPDADGAGTRLQLFARSPFAFTRFTSRRWTDWLIGQSVSWPCTPQPELATRCIDWNPFAPETPMPALWSQGDITLSSGAELFVVRSRGGSRALRLGMNLEPDGTRRPGVLWAALPEVAAAVAAEVQVPGGDWVVLRAWAGSEVVGSDSLLAGTGTLRVEGSGIDALTLDWGFNAEVDLVRMCWVTQSSADAGEAWIESHDGLEEAAERWESEEPVLDPDSHYLLEVTTSARLTKNGNEVQDIERTHVVQFQTGGPPGIIPPWVPAPAPPAPNTAARFPHGGVLADLARYVQWTIPEPGAVAVPRGYDLGCEFSATYVEQMYGADMRIRLLDGNGRPAMDACGQPVVFDNAWEDAPITTLTTSESAWLSQLDACTGAVDWAAFRRDDALDTGFASPSDSLAPERTYIAELEASRPIFTDAFEDLDGFDLLTLDGDPSVSTCSASAGTASIARAKGASQPAVAALAGDETAQDYAVECNATPGGGGAFGLIARYTDLDQYLALELTPGGGRQLTEHSGQAGGFSAVRVLWQDLGTVEVGQTYALSLRCEGDLVTVTIDADVTTARTQLDGGRFGLLSDIPAPDACAFTDLVVRSAPRAPVHRWTFTTSRYLGLSDLLAPFVGHTWPVDGAAPDAGALTGSIAAGRRALSSVGDALAAARAELADAVAASNAIEIPGLREAALAAARDRHDESARVFESLAAALGLPWRPTPPLVELCTVTGTAGEVLALRLDLPEPIPWERMSWSLATGEDGSAVVTDLLLAWSDDGTTALLAREGAAAFADGPWTLDLTLALDVGAERPVWRRGGSTAPDAGTLRFDLGPAVR